MPKNPGLMHFLCHFPKFSYQKMPKCQKEPFQRQFHLQFKTFDEISKALNFRYSVHEPQTGVKWSGVVSDVTSGHADVGVSHLFLTYGRTKIMAYTPAVNYDHFCFLVRN